MTEISPYEPSGELEPLNQRLAALEHLADEHLDGQRVANTTRSYGDDWKAWTEYTSTLGIPETSATAGALVGFVVALEAQGRAPATIDRRLAGVVVGLRERGVEPSSDARKKARAALKGYERRLAEAAQKRGRGKAPALTVKHLRMVSDACPDTLAGIRDRALITLGFGIAARRSEIAHLLLSDVTEHAEGLEVDIRFSKSGARTVAVPHGSHVGTCPVRSWRAWIERSGITEGPAFRQINRHGNMLDAGLSPEAVGEIVKRAGRRAGIPLNLTGHSVRSGLITESRRAGHDAKTISTQSGHSPNSRVLYGYMHLADRWSDNAVKGIGL